MKQAKRLTLILVAMLMLAITLTGCSAIRSFASAIGIGSQTLEEYLSDPETAQQVNEEVASMVSEDAGLSIEVAAEENVLIYRCTMDTQVELTDESIRRMWVNSVIESCAEEQSTYEDIGQQLTSELNLEEVTVRLEYYNADGSELLIYDYANPPEAEMYASVEECLAEEGVAQRFVDEFGLDGTGMSAIAYGEDNTLVYEMTMDEPFEVSEQTAADLEAYTEEQEDAFTVDFMEFRLVVDAPEFTIRYVFKNPDGTVLYSHEFIMDSEDNITSQNTFNGSSESEGQTTTTTETTGAYTNIEEYLADPEEFAEVQSQMDSLSTDELTMRVYGEGNTLVYEAKYTEQLDLSDEAAMQSIQDALQSGLEAQESTYQTIADSLESELQLDDISIRVIYLNQDGTEIYRHDFNTP